LIFSVINRQIEGAFIQGMGWATMEELIYGDKDHSWIRPEGRMFTTGPGKNMLHRNLSNQYKILQNYISYTPHDRHVQNTGIQRCTRRIQCVVNGRC
jgi:xanthine dehydrogenase molybdopterin-binding subunit B